MLIIFYLWFRAGTVILGIFIHKVELLAQNNLQNYVIDHILSESSSIVVTPMNEIPQKVVSAGSVNAFEQA